MRLSRIGIISIVLAAALGACDKTNWESHILHTEDMSEKSVITDAKQRIVWNRKVKDGRTIVCAEPSPDVAQAFSEGMKLAASLSAANETVDGSSQSASASAEFGRSYASAVAELGQRLAVIQLLRDEMYRACEAYANGALTDVSYTLKLARLDKKMATLLTSEIAAGALARPPAALGSSAGVAGVDAEELKTAEQDLFARIAAMKQTGEGSLDADVRKAKLDEQMTATDTAVKKLVSLKTVNAGATASASAQGAGNNIEGPPGGVSRQSLVDIHQNFLDDTGLEPLIDACVTAMSRVNVGTFLQVASREQDLNEWSNTAEFLREALEGALTDNYQSAVRLLFPEARFDAEGNPDRNTRAELKQLLTETEAKIADIYNEADMYALRCMNTFMSDGLNEKGFIGRIIAAKRELRQISVDLKKTEFELLRLQTCREAANLLSESAEKRKALAACVTPIE